MRSLRSASVRYARRGAVVLCAIALGTTAVVASTVAPASAVTCDTTWNSSTANWGTAGDWSNGVPTSGSNACLPAGSYTVSTDGNVGTVASLTIGSGATLAIVNDPDNNAGGITLSSGPNSSNAGTIQLGASNSNVGDSLNISSGTLSNTGVIEIEGEFGSTDHTISGSIDNQGTFTVAGGNVDLNAGGSTFTSTGTVTVDSGATLTVGVANTTTDVTFDLNGGTLTNNGTFTQTAGAFNHNAGTASGNYLNLVNGVAITPDPSSGSAGFNIVGTPAVDTLASDVGANDTLVIQQDSNNNAGVLSVSADRTNAGTIQVGIPGSNVGDNLSVGSGTLTNTGTIETEGEFGSTTQTISGNVDNQGTFTVAAGTVHLDSGVIDDYSTLSVADGTTLRNVDDTLVVEPGGTFALTGSGTYTQDSGATLGVTVDATNTTYTGISGGDTNLDGTLQVTTVGTPATSSTWPIISGVSRSGTFATDEFGSTNYTVLYLSTGVTLVAPAVATATPSLATTSSGGGTSGGSFTDSATLTGFVGSVTNETVSFSLYPTLEDCTGATNAVSGSPVSASLNSGGVTPQSAGITLSTAGTYYWQASYPGDANNNAVTSTCSSEPITVTGANATPSVATTSSGGGTPGGSFSDSATLSGFAGTVTGETVSFSLYPTLEDCTGATNAVSGSPVSASLNSGGVTPQSAGITVSTAGTYYWQASYPGDANNNAVTSSCSSEPITVTPANATPSPTRIFGTDAIATGIQISQAGFSKGSAGAVVLARSDFFSDGLAGGPLAAKVGGPLLITPGTPLSAVLDPRVLTEIERVLPAGRTVYIVGGPQALSPNIDATLTTAGYVVVRVAGANEFSTTVAVAYQLGNPSTVFEATGLFFADTLSAGPAAIHAGGAILLTNGTTQAPETLTYLGAHRGDTRYAIGGPQAAYGADPSAIPVYGPDEFGTSAQVATRFFPNAKVYGAATGLVYDDALTAGVFMATDGRLGPVLLVNPNTPLPPPIIAYLNTLAVGTPGYVFGGPLALAEPSIDLALQAAVG